MDEDQKLANALQVAAQASAAAIKLADAVVVKDNKVSIMAESLQKVLLLLHGQEGQPGLATEQKRHTELLYGTNDRMGLETKVLILWRGHVWLYCLLTSIATMIITLGVQKFMGILK